MARISTERKPRDIGDGLPPGAVVGSMTIHSLILLFLGWGATRVTLPDAPLVYRVELVAAPSQVSARPVPAPKRQKPPEPEPKKSKVPETVPAVTKKPKKSAKPEETKQEKSVPEEAVADGCPPRRPWASRVLRTASRFTSTVSSYCQRLSPTKSLLIASRESAKMYVLGLFVL